MFIKKIAGWICGVLATVGLPFPLFSSIDTTLHSQFLQLPLRFEKNEGQTDSSVQYFSHQRGSSVYFTPEEIVMILSNKASSVLKIQFSGTMPHPIIEGMEKLECKSHYFIGNESQKWLTNIPSFAKICYRDLYPGIDAVFYGNKGQLQYDICVAPGGNPQNVSLQIEGAQNIFIDADGNLQIFTGNDEKVLMLKPFLYQVSNDNTLPVEGEFVLLAQNEIGFHVGIYDTNNALIIDPILSYSTYLGGSGSDLGTGIAVDDNGNVFVTGQTSSPNFPTTPGAYQTSLMGPGNSFITKLNANESTLVYSTYLGNGSPLRGDNASGIAIDSEGNAYIIGTTDSATFPTTSGAFQTTLKGLTNCFITKLNPTGSSLVYSTYLGGSAMNFGDVSGGITVDSDGNAFVTGGTHSTDFPTTAGAFQTSLVGTDSNCFVTKLNATGTALIYSTFLGGSFGIANGDRGFGICINDGGNAYVTGVAGSTDFPTTMGAFQTSLAGASNAFVTEFNETGSALVYSTLLGGSNFDIGFSIALGSNGNAYVAGQASSSDFPTTSGAFQTTLLGGNACFITQFNETGSDLVYSTYLGGSGSSQSAALSIAIDTQGNAYIAGQVESSDFPVTADAFQPNFAGEVDGFVTELNETGSSLVYSTYLGGSNVNYCSGIAIDSSKNIYVTGFTNAVDFPTTPDAFQTALAGSGNSFISIFSVIPPPPSNFQGKMIQNVFITQTDYINSLSWTPNSNPSVIGYKLFRDGALIAQIPATGPFFYNDHNRKKNQKYTYTLVSFNSDQVDSIPLTISL